MKMNDVVSTIREIKSNLADVVPPEVTDRVLEAMGLQVRRSAFGSLASGTGIFLAGCIVGGAVALMFAPKAGLELRSDLEDKLDTVIDKLKNLVGQKVEGEETAEGIRKNKETTAGATTRTPGTIHTS
jgi:YtxH-like protein